MLTTHIILHHFVNLGSYLSHVPNRLMTEAIHGAGISPWEAEILVDVAKNVYFSDSNDLSKLRSGQMPYECVAASESHGKPLEECKKCTVVLTIHEKEDIELGAEKGLDEVRKLRIQRLTEEAREQGGLLTQEDLGTLLCCDVRTIRRAVKKLKEECGICVATRGQQKDIGPSVSHKGIAIKQWLSGKEPNEVALNINHSLKAVERYLQHFARVVFLKRQRFQRLEIAYTIGISLAVVDSYLEIYETYITKKGYRLRWDELDVIGQQYCEAIDFEKKGSTQRRKSKKDGRKQ